MNDVTRSSKELSLQPTIIKIYRNPKYTGPDKGDSYPGWIVPETDGLLAIDQRHEADAEWGEPAMWVVTHLPTGAGVRSGAYTDACTREQAVGVAQRFFREAKARGWPIESNELSALPNAHNAMSNDQKKEFWVAVAGWNL